MHTIPAKESKRQTSPSCLFPDNESRHLEMTRRIATFHDLIDPLSICASDWLPCFWNHLVALSNHGYTTSSHYKIALLLILDDMHLL